MQQIERDYRAPSAAVLVGFHTNRRHHVQVGYLGGLMLLEERQHTLTQISYVPPPGVSIPIQRTENSTFTYRAAAAIGLDVDIELAAHVAVVPQIRTGVFTGNLSVRPAVDLRVKF
jgi:hypothetical protein